jgi:hypothetical protein
LISFKPGGDGYGISTLLSVGGECLGVIQKVKFEACAGELVPRIEFAIISPDLEEIKESEAHQNLLEYIKRSIELLKKLAHM